MTLLDVLDQLPLSYEQGVLYALIFSADLIPELEAVQAATPSQHRAKPVALTDGRYMLCGDLLSEVGEGGLYAAGFSKFNAELFSQVEIVLYDDAIALLPEQVEDLTIAS